MSAPTINRSAMRHNVVLAYLRGVSRKSELAAALVAEYAAKGDLSPDQWVIAERAFDEARVPKEPTTTVPGPSAPARVELLDLSSLPVGMYAVPNGTTRLKVQIDRPEDGKWAGWIFVKDGAVYGEGRKYGHQRPGDRGSYRGEIETELRAIVADPIAAMAEYGRLTSTCGLCHLPLENKLSVERGIGPVCIKKLRAALDG